MIGTTLMAFFFCVVVNLSVAATANYIHALLLLLSDVRDDEFGDPLHDDVYGGSGGFGTEKTNKTWLHGMIAVPFLASSDDDVDELSVYSIYTALW